MIAQAKWHAEIVTVPQLCAAALFAVVRLFSARCCTRRRFALSLAGMENNNNTKSHSLSSPLSLLCISFHCQVRVHSHLILNISLYCGRAHGRWLGALLLSSSRPGLVAGAQRHIEMKIKVISFSFSSSTSSASLRFSANQFLISPSLSHSRLPPSRPLELYLKKLHGSSSIIWSLRPELRSRAVCGVEMWSGSVGIEKKSNRKHNHTAVGGKKSTLAAAKQRQRQRANAKIYIGRKERKTTREIKAKWSLKSVSKQK